MACAVYLTSGELIRPRQVTQLQEDVWQLQQRAQLLEQRVAQLLRLLEQNNSQTTSISEGSSQQQINGSSHSPRLF